MKRMFPDGFLFGAATSAYQIEGAAKEDGRGPSIWDTFSHLDGHVKRGDTGDIACDHYHRLDTDLDLLTELGLNSYRFSIAWPRVMPTGRGAPSQRGLDFYKRVLDGLHGRQIVPMVTLYHWDLPQDLQDRGGWAVRDTALRFAEYVSVVAKELGDGVPIWVTLNEPWCSAFVGHLQGRHAPGTKDLATAVRAAHHLLLAHGYACQRLRNGVGRGQVGITLNLTDVVPASDSIEDRNAAARIDGSENRWFLDPLLRQEYPADLMGLYSSQTDVSFIADGDLAQIAQPIDFLGVNYYEHKRIHADPNEPVYRARELAPQGPLTDAGTSIEPAGLTRILCRIRDEYGPIPVYVTENGACFFDYVDPEGGVDDVERVAYIDAHLAATAQAIRLGVDVRGYYAWAAMDNFEWAHGYGWRFGLVFVEFGNQTRILKRSARWYREFIGAQTGGLSTTTT